MAGAHNTKKELRNKMNSDLNIAVALSDNSSYSDQLQHVERLFESPSDHRTRMRFVIEIQILLPSNSDTIGI